MNDIISYNEVRGSVLRSIREMTKWNNVVINNDEQTEASRARATKENVYLEYLAMSIVNLPMPD